MRSSWFLLKLAVEEGRAEREDRGGRLDHLSRCAMKSIVRCDRGKDCKAYLTRLVKEESVVDKDDEPTNEKNRRFEKSNESDRAETDASRR